MKKINFILICVIGFLLLGLSNCKKDKNDDSSNNNNNNNSTSGKIKDYDNNLYDTVRIGTQTWMVQNIKATHLSDGTAIPNVSDKTAWSNQSGSAYCDYNNDPNNAATYGHLYNWSITDDDKICPVGWHIPWDSEWNKLITYCGGTDVAGGKLKETGTIHWTAPNTGATNSMGFNALPGGKRTSAGDFVNKGVIGIWWTPAANGTPVDYIINAGDASAKGATLSNNSGASVRCIKD
jgi:uncharacterized protein (TIGR02145 family)